MRRRRRLRHPRGQDSCGFGALAEEAAEAEARRRRRRCGAWAKRRLGRPAAAAARSAAPNPTARMRFAADVRLPDMLFACRAPGAAWRRAEGLFARRRASGSRASSSWWSPKAGSPPSATAGGRPSARWPRPSRASPARRTPMTPRSAPRSTRRWRMAMPTRLFRPGRFRRRRRLGACARRHLPDRRRPASSGSSPWWRPLGFRTAGLEVWAPVQDYDAAHLAAADAAGLKRGEVVLYPMPVGDGGGRAMQADAIPIAIELARRTRKPVQLTLSANVSQQPRPAAPAPGGAAWRPCRPPPGPLKPGARGW